MEVPNINCQFGINYLNVMDVLERDAHRVASVCGCSTLPLGVWKRLVIIPDKLTV